MKKISLGLLVGLICVGLVSCRKITSSSIVLSSGSDDIVSFNSSSEEISSSIESFESSSENILVSSKEETSIISSDIISSNLSSEEDSSSVSSFESSSESILVSSEKESSSVSSVVSSSGKISSNSYIESSSEKVSSSTKPSSSSSEKIETYNPDGTVKLPIPTTSLNSTWGQSGKFYNINYSFPSEFSYIYGKQIVDEPSYYANTGNWQIKYPNTGTRMGFQSPLFEEDLKLEVWFSVDEIHGNTDKLDKTNPWIRIYCFSEDGTLIRTKDIESPTKFSERDYHYAFNGEGVNYFEIRFLSQPHEGTKCYNFGISKIGVKSFPYPYDD